MKQSRFLFILKNAYIQENQGWYSYRLDIFMDGKAKQRAELTSDLTPDLQDGVQAWCVM